MHNINIPPNIEKTIDKLFGDADQENKGYDFKRDNLLPPKLNLSDLSSEYVFERIFHKLPSCTDSFYELNEIKALKLIKKIENTKLIYTHYQHSSGCSGDMDNRMSQVFYFLDQKHEILYHVHTGNYLNDTTITITSSSKIDENLKKTILESQKSIPKNKSIGIILQGSGELYVNHNEIDIPVIDIAKNYGKDFLVKNNQIIEKMNSNRSGLYLLHGLPGSGKSHYIKHLITQVNRKFLFIPTSEGHFINSPQMMSVLSSYKNCILVLEDAEKMVISREFDTGNASMVSSLLNLSDGILGSLFSISVLVTFNTEREKIDPALLRKGRLLAEHDFGPLSKEEAIELAKTLGYDHTKITKAMPLADIYGLDQDNYHKEKEKPKIGYIV